MESISILDYCSREKHLCPAARQNCTNLYKIYRAKLAEFIANKYDGVTLPWESALTSTVDNPDIRIILMTDVSEGADAIIAQPQIMTFLQ